MKRRDFLTSGMQLTGSLWLSQFLGAANAMAQTTLAPRFFVEIIVSGGWHTSLAMDPWLAATRLDEKDAFIEYREDQVIRNGNIALGPAMLSLNRFAPKMNIINGIFISATDGGHEAAEIYGTTGRGDGLAGTFAVEYELSRNASAMGIVTSSSLYKGQSSARSTSTYEIANSSVSALQDIPFQNPNSPIANSLLLQKQNAAQYKVLQELIASMNAVNPQLEEGQLTAAAFKSGLAATASLRLNRESLDTHQNHPVQHLASLTKVFEQIKNIFEAFEKIEWANGQSLFDATTFYITSEFSRTPALDGAKGTNHNPLNNSAIIIGPDFKGNQVFGASRIIPSAVSAVGASYLTAQMVDLTTGELMKSKEEAQKRGSLIRPENIIATLADAMKIQRNIFAPVEMDVPSIKLLLK